MKMNNVQNLYFLTVEFVMMYNVLQSQGDTVRLATIYECERGSNAMYLLANNNIKYAAQRTMHPD